MDVVSVAQTAKLFLTGRIPHVEAQRAAIGVEDKRVDLDAQCGDVFLLELTRQMAFHKGSLVVKVKFSQVLMFKVELTLPTPPSPTSTNLKVGISWSVIFLYFFTHFTL